MDVGGAWWRRVLCAALVAAFAILYSFPVADPDYFWHVTTGRWIAEHRALPLGDPFKYTYEALGPESADAKVVTMYLRAYWLADVVMHAADAAAGVTGMIAMRIAVYVVILAAMLRWLGARNAGPIGFVWVCLLALHMTTIPSERPQLFAFLFFPLLLQLLDDFFNAAESSVTGPGIALCLLMLFWANMHGSFVLGVLVIIASAGSALLASKGGHGWTKQPRYFWLAGACLITLANPNGPGLVLEALRSHGGRSDNISELASTFAHFGRKWRADAGYWGIVLLTTVILATCWRRMSMRHLTVAVAMLTLSLMARRHMLYLPLSALAIVPYAGDRLRWGKAGCLCAAAALCFVVSAAEKHSLLTFDQDDGFPERAVSFMADNPTAGHLFNFYDWGGFIPYAMPGRKVFIDGRSVVAAIADDFRKMMEADDWRRLFDEYDIGTAILPAVDRYSGTFLPLATSLIADPGWALVFADDAALVFAKKIPDNMPVIDRHRLTADDFCEHVLRFTDHYRPRWRSSRHFYYARGMAFANLGRWAESVACLREAVAMDPADRAMVGVLAQVIERQRASVRDGATD